MATGEQARIWQLRGLFQSSAAHIHTSIGDDAAVLRMPDGTHLLWTVDVQVEGTHFKREWLTFEALGYRAVMAAVSDLAAMGATGLGLVSSLTLPQAISDADFISINQGILRASQAINVPVVGGNLSDGALLSIGISALGTTPEGMPPLRRQGAKAGDGIFVSGVLGAAALGLRLLQTEKKNSASLGFDFIEAWRTPHARTAMGTELLGQATSAIDISDGLLCDLAHLCAESNVGAQIELSHIPLGNGAEMIAELVGCKATDLALNGGEDYELLFTLPKASPIPTGVYCIGEITGRSHGIVLTDQGKPIPLPSEHGYEHFINLR